jgi:hypothetical protein
LMFLISLVAFIGRKKVEFIHTVYKYIFKSQVFCISNEYLSIK